MANEEQTSGNRRSDRKVIQIAARAAGNGSSSATIILCDDGTVWQTSPISGWELLTSPFDEPCGRRA